MGKLLKPKRFKEKKQNLKHFQSIRIYAIPLRSYGWQNIHWILINIIINLWSFLYVYDVTTAEVQKLSTQVNEQPLFIYYVKLHHHVLMPMIFTNFIWHYFRKGYQIMKCFDHPLLTITMYRYRSQSLFYAVSVELFMNSVYILSRWNLIRSFYSTGDWENVYVFISFFIFVCYLRITWLLMLYQQIFINLTLKQYQETFLHDCQRNSNIIFHKKRLFIHVKNLAQLNGHIQKLMSPILFIAFISESLHVVDTLNQFLIKGFLNYWNKVIERIIRTLLYIGICWLNNENLHQFRCIQNFLLCRKNDLKQIQLYTHNKRIPIMINDRSTMAIYSKFNSLKIYRELFQLPVHYLFTINASVCLNWFFFLISYVSLIYQTRNQ